MRGHKASSEVGADLPAGYRCFACDRLIHRKDPLAADTRDGQEVFIGAECAKKIAAAGEAGWQPPKGGPRLYPLLPTGT
jgi:hypothetical protein